MSLQETARGGEIERTVGALQAGTGVVLVHSAEPQEAIDLAMLSLSRLPEDHAVGIVDVTRCQDDLAFARAFAFSVASTYIGDIANEAFLTGEWRLQRDAELLTLAELTSPRFYAALTEDDVSLADPRELFELSVDAFTRRAADGPTVLALFGAEELAATPTRRSRFGVAHELLWTLRGRLQQSIGSDYVLFAGGDRTSDLITSEDAAFYGWGTEVAIEKLPFDLLRRHLEAALLENPGRLKLWEPFEVRALAMNFAGVCNGSALLAQQLLDVLPAVALRRPEPHRIQEFGLASRTISMLLGLNAERLRAQTRLVKGLATNALRIAVALANDERPYSVVQHPSEAARALRAMVDASIVVRRDEARWSLCDPLFAMWLKQPQAGRLRLDHQDAEPIPRWALTS